MILSGILKDPPRILPLNTHPAPVPLKTTHCACLLRQLPVDTKGPPKHRQAALVGRQLRLSRQLYRQALPFRAPYHHPQHRRDDVLAKHYTAPAPAAVAGAARTAAATWACCSAWPCSTTTSGSSSSAVHGISLYVCCWCRLGVCVHALHGCWACCLYACSSSRRCCCCLRFPAVLQTAVVTHQLAIAASSASAVSTCTANVSSTLYVWAAVQACQGLPAPAICTACVGARD